MLFEQIRHGGCLSYVIACEATRAGIVVDPEAGFGIDQYLALQAEKAVRVRYVLDTHTHADHFTGSRELARLLAAPIVMHRQSAAPSSTCGSRTARPHRGKASAARSRPPGTQRFDMPVLEDRVLTGDTLLIGGTGRTDLPRGDPEALRESLFGKLLGLDKNCRCSPRTITRGAASTIGAEQGSNPRLQAAGTSPSWS